MNTQSELPASKAKEFFSGKGVEYGLIAATIFFVAAALGLTTSIQLVSIFLGCLSLLLAVAGWTSWVFARIGGANSSHFEDARPSQAGSGAITGNSLK